MKILGNILWLIFGGFEAALAYFTGSLAMAVTIIGIPWAWQTFKIGILCLWPFGAEVKDEGNGVGCLNLLFNVIWILTGGIWAWLIHVFFGLLLCITIIGLPFGKQHFKMAALSLAPFGKDIVR